MSGVSIRSDLLHAPTEGLLESWEIANHIQAGQKTGSRLPEDHAWGSIGIRPRHGGCAIWKGFEIGYYKHERPPQERKPITQVRHQVHASQLENRLPAQQRAPRTPTRSDNRNTRHMARKAACKEQWCCGDVRAAYFLQEAGYTINRIGPSLYKALGSTTGARSRQGRPAIARPSPKHSACGCGAPLPAAGDMLSTVRARTNTGRGMALLRALAQMLTTPMLALGDASARSTRSGRAGHSWEKRSIGKRNCPGSRPQRAAQPGRPQAEAFAVSVEFSAASPWTRSGFAFSSLQWRGAGR